MDVKSVQYTQGIGGEVMNVLSLFSGYGGLDMGLEMVFPEARTVCFCEIEPYAQKVLAKRFPGIPIMEDVYDLQGRCFFEEGIEIDVITAGWPCQGNSIIGNRLGLLDDRSGLFFQVARIIREVDAAQGRLPMFFGENVPGILSVDGGNAWLEVLGTLAEMGYDYVKPGDIRACCAGAMCVRERIFIVAHNSCEGYKDRSNTGADGGNEKSFSQGLRPANLPKADLPRDNWENKPVLGRGIHGPANRVDRIRMIGNGVRPDQAALALRLLLSG